MGLDLVGIKRSSGCQGCDECDGGIARVSVAEYCTIEDIVIDANRCITSVVSNTTGAWTTYEHDTDDSASFSQVTEKIGFRSKRINQSFFTKFSCVTKEISEEANRLKGCCAPVFAIEYTNGDTVLMGVDIIA